MLCYARKDDLNMFVLVSVAQRRSPAFPKLPNLTSETSASSSHNKNNINCTQESLDVWSLGVMVFELFTGEPAIQMLEGKDKVVPPPPFPPRQHAPDNMHKGETSSPLLSS